MPVDWKSVAKFRDMVAHNYSNVNLEMVWNIINRDVPELWDAVHAISDSFTSNNLKTNGKRRFFR